MEAKDEVHSDDGSYELVNLDDYASETEHLNMEAVVSSSMDLSDDSSYDLLCSEVSDTLLLTEEEDFHSYTVSEDNLSEETKSLSSKSAKRDMEEFKGTTSSVPKEGEMGIKSETGSDPKEGGMGIKNEIYSDSRVQPIPDRVKKGKKRHLMTMISESSNLDASEIPAQIKLKDDIREVAKNHIIRYLPAKSLFKCRRVSKEWNKWISSPFCAHMQSHYFRKTSGFFQNSKSADIRFISLDNSAYGVPYPSLDFLPKHVSIKSSCNGLLLCQAFFDENEFYICNPANKQWIKLPPSTYYHGVQLKIVLAFEPSPLNFEPHYQVICPFSLPDPNVGPIVYFDIYDSKTNSWRVSEMVCVDLDESDVKSAGIFVNGIVYWETTSGELLAFDLKNEIYSVQKLPFDKGGALSNIHGELCFVRAQYHHPRKQCILDIFGGGVMDLKNTIAFDISIDGVENGELVECIVLGNACDDVVAVIVKLSQGQKRLLVYHVKDEKVQGPWVFNRSKKLFPYVNSLVSIRG